MEILLAIQDFAFLMFFIFSILNVIRHIHLLTRFVRDREESSDFSDKYTLSDKSRIWLAVSISFIITFIIL